MTAIALSILSNRKQIYRYTLLHWRRRLLQAKSIFLVFANCTFGGAAAAILETFGTAKWIRKKRKRLN